MNRWRLSQGLQRAWQAGFRVSLWVIPGLFNWVILGHGAVDTSSWRQAYKAEGSVLWPWLRAEGSVYSPLPITPWLFPKDALQRHGPLCNASPGELKWGVYCSCCIPPRVTYWFKTRIVFEGKDTSLAKVWTEFYSLIQTQNFYGSPKHIQKWTFKKWDVSFYVSETGIHLKGWQNPCIYSTNNTLLSAEWRQ